MKSTVRHFIAWQLAILMGAGILSMPARSWAEASERPLKGYYAQPRVHFAFADFARVRLQGQDFISGTKWSCADVENLLKQAGATQWDRLFYGHAIEKLDELRSAGEARRGIRLPDLNNWFTVVLPSADAAAKLAASLAGNPHIRAAAVTQIPLPSATDIAPATPSYEASQGYLEAAPLGVGIASAWSEPSGTGFGMQILHHEGGWITDHEDLDVFHTGGGNEYPAGDALWYDHGTACLAVMAAPLNNYGVTGLVPQLGQLMTRAFWEDGSPNTWIEAAALLNMGDVVSASWGYPGSAPPGLVCPCNCGQFGGLPAESDPADFDAIQTLSANGLIVVCAASNGSVPLDDPFYGGLFDLSVRDSGALLVAAVEPGGAPSCFTNHGSRIDAHAWGSSVTSAGYGDLFHPNSDPRQRYTSSFSGTSSACPIVSGCVAALQGIYKHGHAGQPLDAWQMRTLLRNTGTPQTADFDKLVGTLPDLAQLIPAANALAQDVLPPVVNHAPLPGTSDTVGPYNVFATIDDPSGVVSADLHVRVDGGAWTSTPMTGEFGTQWNGLIDGQPMGSGIEYYITAVDGATPANTATTQTWYFAVTASTAGIVLYTPTNSTYSTGYQWHTALLNAGYDGPITNIGDLNQVILGEDTDVLVVLLGVFDQTHLVPAGSTAAQQIQAFIQSGGRVYLEGGDCWFFDPLEMGGADFGPLFGVTGESDGGGDLFSVTCHGAASGTFAYEGSNEYIDQLAGAGASQLFSNTALGYSCGFYQTGARTTACASFELAGLTGFQRVVGCLFGPALFNVLSNPPHLIVNPDSVSATATAGGATSLTLNLQNSGAGLLYWSATLRQNATAAAPRGAGGPDAQGYQWIDSDEPGGPTPAFLDIAGTGTALALDDDQSLGPLALGFVFPFYDQLFTHVRVCDNGFLSFSSTATDYENLSIPTALEPNGLLAAFWDDLDPASGGTIHYQAFADRFVVQWSQLPRWGSPAETYTFQALLFPDGSVEYQYDVLAGDLSSATVGIENPVGDAGVQVVHNAPYLHDHMAIRFSRTDAATPWLGLDSYSGILAGAASATVTVSLSAQDLADGTYTGGITFGTSEPGSHLIPVTFVVGTPGLGAPLLDIALLASSQVRLSWAPVAGATGYNIYSAPTPDGPWSLLATAPASPQDLVVPGTATQVFRVSATN